MTMSLAAQRCAVLLGAIALALLAGCASKVQAPVVERAVLPSKPSAAVPAAKPGDFHIVKKGDTLYSIALEHGQSHHDVAAWNNIENPGLIKIGQQLRVTPPDAAAVVRPVAGPAAVEARPLAVSTAAVSAAASTETYKREPKGGKQPYTEQVLALAHKFEEPRGTSQAARPEGLPAEPANGEADLAWAWPSNGKMMMGFAEGGSKGIDIAGRIGDPVLAAEAGKVTYAGSAIRGYGNLLIIQHQNSLSSVYAHNSKLLAKEGQAVAKGQKVAEIGNTDSDQPKLHFEIRRQGKPLDPLKYLPQR